MDNSDMLRLFAEANRKCGRNEYADLLENTAAVYEAAEILREEQKNANNPPKG